EKAFGRCYGIYKSVVGQNNVHPYTQGGEEMKNTKTQTMVKYSMLVGLTIVMTMIIQIPTPATNGYLNLGDMVVFMGALILGRKGGLLVGGIGSSMADLLLGYSHYAPITLMVKGLEGYIAGRILETKLGRKFPLIGTIIGGIW